MEKKNKTNRKTKRLKSKRNRHLSKRIENQKHRGMRTLHQHPNITHH